MSNSSINSVNYAGKDPFQMSLELAEKIISSLSDKALVNRYFEQKNRILSSPSSSPSRSFSPHHAVDTTQAFQSYQKFVEEKSALVEELSRLQSSKPDFSDSPENKSIASLLRELQMKIHPELSPKPLQNATEELDNLRKVLDATLDTMNFLKASLQNENTRLKNELNECTQAMNKRLDAAREKEAKDNMELADRDEELEQQVVEAEQSLQELKDRLQHAKEENESLLQQHSSSADMLEKMEEEIKATEIHIEETEEQSERLFDEIDSLKKQLTIKNKELASLQTLAKFGVDVGHDFNIEEEIDRLRERSSKLKSENAQMEFELKRLEKRSSGSIIDTSSSIYTDENELAAQILRSKLG